MQTAQEQQDNQQQNAQNLIGQVLSAVQSNPELSSMVGNFAAQYLEPGATRNLAEILKDAERNGSPPIEAEYVDDDERMCETEYLDDDGIGEDDDGAIEALGVFAEAFGLCTRCLASGTTCGDCRHGQLANDIDEALLLELLLPVLPRLGRSARIEIRRALGGRSSH